MRRWIKPERLRVPQTCIVKSPVLCSRRAYFTNADLVLSCRRVGIFGFELNFVRAGFFSYNSKVRRSCPDGIGLNLLDSLSVAQTMGQIGSAMVDDNARVLAFCQRNLKKCLSAAGEFALNGLTDFKNVVSDGV